MNILVKICTHFQTKKHTLFRGVGANFLKICHKGVPPFLPLPSSNLSHDPYHRSTSHTPLTKLRTEALNHRNMNPIPTSSVFLSQSHRVSGILLSGWQNGGWSYGDPSYGGRDEVGCFGCVSSSYTSRQQQELLRRLYYCLRKFKRWFLRKSGTRN